MVIYWSNAIKISAIMHHIHIHPSTTELKLYVYILYANFENVVCSLIALRKPSINQLVMKK